MSATYLIEQEQWVRRPLDEVFAFFSDAANLEALTPDWLRFSIITPPPIEMAAGALIDYRLHWHGIPLRWKTKITVWEPPHKFQDFQLKGPYSLWRHTHRFTSVNGGTQIGDEVQYALPFGPVGQIAHAISVRRNVEAIFQYRQQKIQAMFGN
jgi:ligand-binding SRPBCC domain-containing protein